MNGATLRSQPTEINDDDNDAYRTPVELTIVSQSVSQPVRAGWTRVDKLTNTLQERKYGCID